MSDLLPYTGTAALSRESRRTGRAISRVHGDGQVRQAAIDAEVDVTMAKLDAVTTGTGQALTAVARVAQAETALAQNFPGASGRLAFLAERHMLAASDIVEVLVCRVRHQ
jgi:hypothetical protein